MFVCSDHAVAIALVFIGAFPFISSIVYFKISLDRINSKLRNKFAKYQIFMAFLLQNVGLDLSRKFIDHGLGKEASNIVRKEREKYNKFNVFLVPMLILGLLILYVLIKLLVLVGMCPR